MTDAEIQKILDDTKLYVVQEMFEAELFAFARAIEQRTVFNQKAKWYLMGAEDERRACAKIADEVTQEIGGEYVLSSYIAAAIRARGENNA